MVKSVMLYSLVFLYSIIALLIYQKNNLKQKKVILSNNYSVKFSFNFFAYIIIIAFPVFLSSIRWGIGTDFWNYLSEFHMIQNMKLSQSLMISREPLFTLLNYLGNLLFPGEEWGIFFLSAFISMFFVVLSLNFYKKNLTMATGMFIFFMLYYIPSLNVVRQMIAVTIVLYSYRFVIEHKVFKYLFMIIIASLFHQSAIICSTFYILNHKKNKTTRIKKIIYYFLIVVSPFLINPLLSFVQFIPFLAVYVDIYDVSFNGYDFSFIINIIPVILPAVLFRKRLINKNANYEFFVNLSWLIIPMYLLSYYQQWFGRLTFYVEAIQVIIIPLIISTIQDKSKRRIATCFAITYYISYFVYAYIIKNAGDSLPYQSFIPFFDSK